MNKWMNEWIEWNEMKWNNEWMNECMKYKNDSPEVKPQKHQITMYMLVSKAGYTGS
jgi:hypothetical protein